MIAATMNRKRNRPPKRRRGLSLKSAGSMFKRFYSAAWVNLVPMAGILQMAGDYPDIAAADLAALPQPATWTDAIPCPKHTDEYGDEIYDDHEESCVCLGANYLPVPGRSGPEQRAWVKAKREQDAAHDRAYAALAAKAPRKKYEPIAWTETPKIDNAFTFPLHVRSAS